MDSIFSTMVSLPLFQGISTETLAEIAGKAKLHFLKFPPGEVIVREGEPCTHLKFIISGSVRVTIANSDGRFAVSQTLNAPDVIAPEFLFGRATDYPCQVTAIDTISILQLSKNDCIEILRSDRIFLFNLLNILSMNAQKAVEGILALTNGSIQERIAFWVAALTQPTGTDIALSCRHRDLYSLFGVPRQSFMAALEHLREMGIITYTTSEIRILDRRRLVALLHQNAEEPILPASQNI